MEKPVIAITIGDPAGIGPEITVKALQDGELYAICRPLVIGDESVVRRALSQCSLSMNVHVVGAPGEGTYAAGTIDLLLPAAQTIAGEVRMGQVDASCGRAAYAYIEQAAELARTGSVGAVATAPINKESLQAAQVPYIGHTEIFGGLAGVEDPLTMFEVRNMRIFFLTRHVSLRKACDLVTSDRLLDYIERCTAALRQLGVSDGVMAVAGLNPHSGEHGLFGDEEVSQVTPAVEEAKRRGFAVAGPIGADSVFAQCLTGKYNSVLSLYHDQGHIAAKTYDFERTISVTLGMPFLRTSVDHGTAFDIAGTGKASEVSMVEAVRVAAKYAPHFARK
ncbi:MAG TPA: 4-hydroxythreonine-4-phosphate dehydrogenase PdxA [Spirochaetia bacterium]|nr:4-hydroxythreonine-4-phosphate dehydrogenase PdxA [Spirochaetia bacterium]